ncbi:RNA-directed DNA polymerase, eukaryota, reverse transcriptase zinc-binding domain protein [Tanacetum coccineum]
MSLSQSVGGLGVGCLRSKNLSLLGKWKLRFLTEEHALWRTVIREFYGEDGGFYSSSSSLGGSGVWIDIIKAIKNIEAVDSNFHNSFVRKVVDGTNTSFWHDPWGYLVNGSWVGAWSWRIPPRRRALDDLISLTSSLDSVMLSSGGCDKCLGFHHKWNSWIPRKVNVMVWKSSLNRLATCPNLMARGVYLLSSACPFCDLVSEDIEHVLVKCPRVSLIWRKVWSWWNLPTPVSFPSFSIMDVACGHIPRSGCASLAKAMNRVFRVA